jgi:hypothetical protein
MATVPGVARSQDSRYVYVRGVNRNGGEFKNGEAYYPELRQRVLQALILLRRQQEGSSLGEVSVE